MLVAKWSPCVRLDEVYRGMKRVGWGGFSFCLCSHTHTHAHIYIYIHLWLLAPNKFPELSFFKLHLFCLFLCFLCFHCDYPPPVCLADPLNCCPLLFSLILSLSLVNIHWLTCNKDQSQDQNLLLGHTELKKKKIVKHIFKKPSRTKLQLS